MADSDVRQQLSALLQRKDLRSADRAFMQTMLKQVKSGKDLNYQQTVNLWAYLSRYRDHGSVQG